MKKYFSKCINGLCTVTIIFFLAACGDDAKNLSEQQNIDETSEEKPEAQNDYIDMPVEDVIALAEKGDTDAMFYLSSYSIKNRKYEDAAMWTEKISDSGINDVNYILGLMYYNGIGVEKDLETALHFFENAVETQFSKEAEYAVGYMYFSGEGVEQDFDKGMEWIKKSATNENDPYELAVKWLAVYYMANNEGYVTDYKESEKWFDVYETNFEMNYMMKVLKLVNMYRTQSYEEMYKGVKELLMYNFTEGDDDDMIAFTQFLYVTMNREGLGDEEDLEDSKTMDSILLREGAEGNVYAEEMYKWNIQSTEEVCDYIITRYMVTHLYELEYEPEELFSGFFD